MSDQIMIINDGKIQRATPVDIYDEPLNHFVADFIGESNIVPHYEKDYVVSINGQDFIVSTGWNQTKGWSCSSDQKILTLRRLKRKISNT